MSEHDAGVSSRSSSIVSIIILCIGPLPNGSLFTKIQVKARSTSTIIKAIHKLVRMSGGDTRNLNSQLDYRRL